MQAHHRFLAHCQSAVNRGSRYTTIWTDEWLDKHLAVLAWRISLLPDDIIARHYWEVGRAEYARYQSSRSADARWKSWRAISAGLSWLAQLDGGSRHERATAPVTVRRAAFTTGKRFLQ